MLHSSSSFADEEEALNSIMKDLAALGKCGGLLDSNRNKTSIHSNKQVSYLRNPICMAGSVRVLEFHIEIWALLQSLHGEM